MLIEAANDFRGILVNEPTRNRVGVDNWLRRLFSELATLIVFPLTEVSIYNSGHQIPKPRQGKK
jgi:hypothetical protein